MDQKLTEPSVQELVDVTAVTPLDGYVVRLVFSDGYVRHLDLGPFLRGPVFEPLREPGEFAKIAVDPELGTVCWPGGADLDPVVLRYGHRPAWSDDQRTG